MNGNKANLHQCKKCKREFDSVLEGKVYLCPTCGDRAQGRPSVVLSRTQLMELNNVYIESMPPNDIWWRKVSNDPKYDKPSWKMTICSKYLYPELRWNGTLVVYSDYPRTPGATVTVYVRQVEHLVRVHYHPTADGVVRVKHNISDKDKLNSVNEIEVRPYLFLEPSESKGTPTYIMRWSTTPPDEQSVASWQFQSGEIHKMWLTIDSTR